VNSELFSIRSDSDWKSIAVFFCLISFVGAILIFYFFEIKIAFVIAAILLAMVIVGVRIIYVNAGNISYKAYEERIVVFRREKVIALVVYSDISDIIYFNRGIKIRQKHKDADAWFVFYTGNNTKMLRDFLEKKTGVSTF